MKNCLGEAELQSFFDRELPPEVMEATARHIASCAACARAAREVEQQSAALRAALEPEMTVPVPTEKLRARISAAMADVNSPAPAARTRAGWLQPFAGLFQFAPRRAVVFASLLAIIILGSILAAVELRTERGPAAPLKALVPATSPGENVVAAASPLPVPLNSGGIKLEPKPAQQSNRPRPGAAPKREGQIKLIPGEQSYLRTIVVLDQNLKQNDQRSMPAATRAEYERNLKLVDYAIAATRSKAKRNPNDPDAAEFLFAAYQSKIDLLNTVSEARLAQH